MVLTSAGLTNAGLTNNFQVQYEDTLSNQALIIANAQALLTVIENEFKITTGWFSTPNGKFGPGNRQIVNLNLPDTANPNGSIAFPGANNNGYGRAINLDALNLAGNASDGAEKVKMLFVLEWVEILMSLSNGRWNAGDSSGEGLSQYCGILRFPNGHHKYYRDSFVNSWLSSTRDGKFVSGPPERTDKNSVSFGCALLFLFYLNAHLGFSTSEIIQKGASTLAGTYTNLTGDATDPFPAFKSLIDTYFPGISTISSGDLNNPFPLGISFRSVKNMAISRIPNHLDVFWVGQDGGVGTAWWDQNANDGKWNAPFSIAPPGSAVAGAITCVAHNQNHLDVFWVGQDGGVGTAWWDQNANDGKWNAPFSIAPPGSAVAGAITCVAHNQNHLDVFWVGQDGGVGTAWWDQNANDGKWNPPFPIAPPGAASGRAITCVARSQNHLDVFWVGPDGGVGTAWWDQNANDGKWNAPFPIAPPGSASGRAIYSVSRIPNHLDVFWVGPDGGVGTAWWDQNANDGKWNSPFPIAPPGSAVA